MLEAALNLILTWDDDRFTNAAIFLVDSVYKIVLHNKCINWMHVIFWCLRAFCVGFSCAQFGVMEIEECSVTRLGEIYLRATWVERDLFLMVISGTDAWRGQLLEDQFKAIDEKNIGSSLQLAKEAFSAPSENNAVSLEGGKLVWRKVGVKAKMILAKIDLSPVNFLDTQREIFDHLVDANRDIALKNREYARRQENLVAELKKSRTMLKDFERVKNEIEDRLYETFLPVLNAKKRKIEELEDELNGPSGGKTSTAAEDYGSDTEEENSEKEEDKSKDDPAGCKDTNLDTDDSLDLLNQSL